MDRRDFLNATTTTLLSSSALAATATRVRGPYLLEDSATPAAWT